MSTGPFGSSIGSVHFRAQGIPVLRGSNLSEDVGVRLQDDDIVFLDPCKAEEFSRSTAEKGDLIFTCWGTVGQVGLIDENAKYPKYIISNKQMKLTPDPALADSQFLYYFFSNPAMIETIKGNAIGSSVPGFNLGQLKSMKIRLPTLDKQKNIVEVIGSVDDKIHFLRKQNKSLEEMADLAFRKAFQNPEIQDDQRQLDHFIEVNPFRSLPRGIKAPYLEMSCVRTDAFHPDSWYEREFASGTKFQNGDTLLARITPCLENGKTCFVNFLDEGVVAWGSTEYIVLRARNFLNPFFSYVLAKNSVFRDFAIGCMSGSSGRQRVEVSHLVGYELNMPSPSEIEIFNNAIEPLALKLNANFREIRSLTQIRDSLLPKLMSGEIQLAGDQHGR